MEDKEFKRKVAEHEKAKQQMIKDKVNSDKATHGENHTWKYDPSTGSLK